MTAHKGRNVLLKYYNGASYVTVGGARKLSIKVNNEIVDITTSDDSGIRKLLEAAGVTAWSITFEGIYVEDAASTAIRTAAATNAHVNFQFYTPGTAGKTYQGSFAIKDYGESAEYNATVTDSLNLESAGPVTIS